MFKLDTNSEVNDWLTKKNISIPTRAFFIKEVYIHNNGQDLVFNMEDFEFITKTGSSNLPEIFNKYEGEAKTDIDIEYYDKETPCKTIILETTTKAYGKVKIELMKFKNPQIRNGYNIITEKPITLDNTKGAVLFYQRIKNIQVKKLTSLKQLSKFKKKQTNVRIKEVFIDKTLKNKVEKFL